MALDSKAAHALLSQVLSLAHKVAADAQVQASLTSGRSANTRFARGQVTSTGDVEETSVRIQVTQGKRSASTTTNQTDAASIRTAIERAVRLARLAPENPEEMPVLGPQKYAASSAAVDAEAARLDAATRAESIAAAIARAEQAKLQLAGFFTHNADALALATSAGARAYHPSTRVEFTTTARTEDGTGSGWAGAVSRRAADVRPTQLAERAIDKSLRSAKPRRLEPGRYTVVLEPEAVGNLLASLTSSLGAREADEGRSFFAKKGGGTRLGEKLFADLVTLRSDPTSPETPDPPFDPEGLALRPVTWIDKGTVSALSYSRYWGQKSSKPPTGAHASYHLLGGTATAEELIRGVKKGLLVTRFWYLRRVDPQFILITGLTRDGLFLIEDGAVVGPVINFRFNESPVTMLKNVDALTRETALATGAPMLRVPALRTHEFNFASISEAV